MRRVILIILFVFMIAPVSSAMAVTLKIATAVPEGSSWMKQMRIGAAEIKERTGGRVEVKFYGGGVMGNDVSVLRKIRVGQLQGGAFTGGGLSSVCPDLKLFSLPFLFRNTEEVRAVRENLDPLIKKGLEEKGFVSFGFAGGGFAYLMSNTVVHGVDDIKGRKIWVPEGDTVGYSVMESMGLSPVTLSLIDVMTGLQTGLLDIVASTPTAALAFQWQTKVKYMAEAPLVYVVATLAIDKNAYARIAPEDQAVVDEVMENIYRQFDEQGVSDVSAAMDALKAQGIEFVAINQEDMRTWRETAISVERRLADEGAYSKPLFELLVESLNGGHADWSSVQ